MISLKANPNSLENPSPEKKMVTNTIILLIDSLLILIITGAHMLN